MPVIEGANLSLTSTSLDAKTKIIIGSDTNALVVDEANTRIGIGVAAPATTVGISGEADCNIVQEREATAATAGRNTLIQAGGAKSGGTDLAGGTLTLAGGIATGSGDSKIAFQVATAGSTGTADAAPATVLELDSAGLVFTGEATRSIEVGDSSAAVGGALALAAGAGDGTNQAGGDLTLSSGASTGTGTSKVTVSTSPAGSTGAAANTPAVVAEFRGNGDVVTGPQAQLAQAATGGFLQIPEIAAAPSGAPTNATGKVSICYCAADDKIYVYRGGTWRATAALT